MYIAPHHMAKRQKSLLKPFLTICSAAETGLVVLTLRVAGDLLDSFDVSIIDHTWPR